MKKRDYYWDRVSEEISKLFKHYFSRNMSICEIGFAGGHFLEYLDLQGYQNLSGIEIREEQFNKTRERFLNRGLKVKLINDDVFNVKNKYDAIYSTGLIQCFDSNVRKKMIKKMSDMASICILTVPVINEDRNLESSEPVAVAGCSEYCTKNLVYELSCYWNLIRCGEIKKEATGIDDDFLYFICQK